MFINNFLKKLYLFIQLSVMNECSFNYLDLDGWKMVSCINLKFLMTNKDRKISTCH